MENYFIIQELFLDIRMKITNLETFRVDGGWRPWTFVKVSTDEGLAGWSEATDSHGSPRGIAGVIEDLKYLLLGKDPREVEKLFWFMFGRTRQAAGGISQKAIASLQNAFLDIKAKALGIPVYELFGGPVRKEIPIYWSRCGTGRVRDWQYIGKEQLKSPDDIPALVSEVKARGYKAFKTNIVIFDDPPYVYMPGFSKSDGWPALNPPRFVMEALEDYIGALREAAGEEMHIMLDLNLNFRTDGYIKAARRLEKFNLFWLEIDSDDPEALLQIKNSARIPIASAENLTNPIQYRPFLEKHSLDVAIVDVIWNGLLQARKIADLAEVYQLNVATHAYHGPFAPLISANFAALTPNFKIMETDVDEVPWREEFLTNPPVIRNGIMEIPTGPGWGSEVNEEAIRKHPWPKEGTL